MEEWHLIMSADEAQALRDVLSDDIEQARRLIEGERVRIKVIAGDRLCPFVVG